MSSTNRTEVIHLVTVPKSLVLLRGQIKYLIKRGYKASILTSDGKELDNYNETKRIYRIDMNREISLKKDFLSLSNIIGLFKEKKPLIVNSGTPKAGLLGITAAFLTGVPIRIYTMRGLKLQTSKGFKYSILWLMEKVCCTLATDVLCISPSIRQEMIDLKLAKKDKTVVLGNGSSNGINLNDFPSTLNKSSIRIKNYDENKFTLGYIGRIVRDKGIDDIIDVFNHLRNQGIDCQLVLVGSIEDGDPITLESYNAILNDENIIYLEHVENTSKYYYLIDVFLFLTAREGFGNVSIEAQAAKTPVITYNVTGARDTVINNETGFIVEKGDLNDVIEKTLYLYNNTHVQQKMGEKGRKYVKENFSNELIWESMDQFYEKKISNIK
ncbi:glycosyltransferase family 4 protein [Salinicoccus kekensis]|uniref:Glycosyltransferase involved in cell wall bisynthesis n=1 Tax=Salinicoccus kekensis TaxID=714307 RepID=A0A285USP0_9STAP|nr:glycosyltransferase family 4 protein [Salinicoccus kekensis]SOC44707.1 glycosyltransferase involved in cell wall bisynthesis [Salinicoccus kekensis]